jgi:hypothetical protein
VVAQGVGVVLLVLTLLLFVGWTPNTATVALVLASQLALWLLLRRPLGRWLQWNRLLAVDFESAGIHSVTQVPSKPLFEKAPTYLVRTEISAAAHETESPRDPKADDRH